MKYGTFEFRVKRVKRLLIILAAREGIFDAVWSVARIMEKMIERGRNK